MRRWLRILSVVVVALAGHAVLLEHAPERRNGMGRLEMNEIECPILIDGSLYSSRSRPVGFSYEILSDFSQFSGLKVRIAPPAASPSCWDSLAIGSYDIAIVDFSKERLPDGYASRIIASMPLRDSMLFCSSLENLPLIEAVNFWLAQYRETRRYSQLCSRYFRTYCLSDGRISSYDEIIKRESAANGLDWRLVAALIYQESHFSERIEGGNAKGLMQIRDATGARFGAEDLFDPEQNVKAGTKYLNYLMKRLGKDGELDSVNLIKFTLASYNAGDGQIEKCRDFAAEMGFDRNDWEQVVLSFPSMPNFSGKVTTAYVDNILSRYQDYVYSTEMAK